MASANGGARLRIFMMVVMRPCASPQNYRRAHPNAKHVEDDETFLEVKKDNRLRKDNPMSC